MYYYNVIFAKIKLKIIYQLPVPYTSNKEHKKTQWAFSLKKSVQERLYWRCAYLQVKGDVVWLEKGRTPKRVPILVVQRSRIFYLFLTHKEVPVPTK